MSRNRHHILVDLIHRTKAAVREFDNLNYRKMKKILMVDDCTFETESSISESTNHDPSSHHSQSSSAHGSAANQSQSQSIFHTGSDEISLTGNQSSKSDSINSERSLIFAQTHMRASHDTDNDSNNLYANLAPPSNGQPQLQHHHQQPQSNGPQHFSRLEAGSTITNNFATIKTTSIVTKQQKEHMQEEIHEQMSGYKRLRREHHAALVKLEERCKLEMESHKNQLDREYDSLLQQFSRELEKVCTLSVEFRNTAMAKIISKI